jgi:hypothetical protein
MDAEQLREARRQMGLAAAAKRRERQAQGIFTPKETVQRNMAFVRQALRPPRSLAALRGAEKRKERQAQGIFTEKELLRRNSAFVRKALAPPRMQLSEQQLAAIRAGAAKAKARRAAGNFTAKELARAEKRANASFVRKALRPPRGTVPPTPRQLEQRARFAAMARKYRGTIPRGPMPGTGYKRSGGALDRYANDDDDNAAMGIDF